MPKPQPQPWKPSDATDIIRGIAKGEFALHLTEHARAQMKERDLATGDVLHVLKRGFVYEDAQSSTRAGYYKYKIDCKTPNSGARIVRVVVLPCLTPSELKAITVMWRDEDR